MIGNREHKESAPYRWRGKWGAHQATSITLPTILPQAGKVPVTISSVVESE